MAIPAQANLLRRVRLAQPLPYPGTVGAPLGAPPRPPPSVAAPPRVASPSAPGGPTAGQRIGGLNYPPQPPPQPGLGQRIRTGKLGRLGKIGLPVAAGLEAINVANVAADPTTTGADVATQVAEGAGKVAGGYLGAQLGGALGVAGGPFAPVTVPLGALAGGAAGYFGGEQLIKKGREFFGGDPRSPAEQLPPPDPASTTTMSDLITGGAPALTQAQQISANNERGRIETETELGHIAANEKRKIGTAKLGRRTPANEYAAVQTNLNAGATGEEAGRLARQGTTLPPTAVVPLGALPPGTEETENIYGLEGVNRYTDASGVPTFTNKGRLGYAEIQRMADTPTGAPVSERANRAQGGGGGGLSIVPGLFSGPSQETEQALREARQAATDRGDFEAVERSYLTTPQEKSQYDAARTERTLLRRLRHLPAGKAVDALKGLTDLRTAQQGALPTLDQIRASTAPGLLANGRELTPGEQAVFGQRPALAQAPKVYNLPQFDAEGTSIAPLPYTMGAQNNAVPVNFPGAPGQAQPAQPLPEGHTPESARTNAIAIAKESPARLAEINQFLQTYGLPPLTNADLR